MAATLKSAVLNLYFDKTITALGGVGHDIYRIISFGGRHL